MQHWCDKGSSRPARQALTQQSGEGFSLAAFIYLYGMPRFYSWSLQADPSGAFCTFGHDSNAIVGDFEKAPRYREFSIATTRGQSQLASAE